MDGGVLFLDYDNDTYKDLYVANGYWLIDENGFNAAGTLLGSLNRFYINSEGLIFRDSTDKIKLNELQSMGVSSADYDNDGDIDMYVTNTNGSNNLYQNNYSQENHWLSIRLRGTKSNSLGIGARVTIKTPKHTYVDQVMGGMSYLSQSEYALHFGLGKNENIDSITIHWPSGIIQKLYNVSIDQEIVITEE